MNARLPRWLLLTGRALVLGCLVFCVYDLLQPPAQTQLAIINDDNVPIRDVDVLFEDGPLGDPHVPRLERGQTVTICPSASRLIPYRVWSVYYTDALGNRRSDTSGHYRPLPLEVHFRPGGDVEIIRRNGPITETLRTVAEVLAVLPLLGVAIEIEVRLRSRFAIWFLSRLPSARR